MRPGVFKISPTGVFQRERRVRVDWKDLNKNQVPPVGSQISARSVINLIRHHGVYIGTALQLVVHYTEPAIVKLGTLKEFIANCDEYRYAACDCPPAHVVTRALLNLNRANYSATLENCEHFASFCRTGDPMCGQVGNQNYTRIPSFLTGIAMKSLHSYCNFETFINCCHGWALVSETEKWMAQSTVTSMPSYVPRNVNVSLCQIAKSAAASSGSPSSSFRFST